MVEETTQEFVLSQCRPRSPQGGCFQKEIEAQIEVGIFSVVLKRRQPSFTPSLTLRSGLSVVMLPLATVKRTLGMVMVLTPLQESLVTQENMRLLSVLARQCSLVMENSILYEKLRRDKESLEEANEKILYLSQRDALTGCFNRGYMNDQLPREIRRALRYRRALSLALCDLDHFKTINDSYGHQCGDRVLKEFVKCSERARPHGFGLAGALRRGGVPAGAAGNGAGKRGTAGRTAAGCTSPAKTLSGRGKQSRSRRASESWASAPGSSPKRLRAEALLNRADEHLYRAKQKGRNRVVSGPFAS